MHTLYLYLLDGFVRPVANGNIHFNCLSMVIGLENGKHSIIKIPTSQHILAMGNRCSAEQNEVQCGFSRRETEREILKQLATT